MRSRLLPISPHSFTKVNKKSNHKSVSKHTEFPIGNLISTPFHSSCVSLKLWLVSQIQRRESTLKRGASGARMVHGSTTPPDTSVSGNTGGGGAPSSGMGGAKLKAAPGEVT